MWFGIIIVSIIVVGFLTVSLWVKENYEKNKASSIEDCDLNENKPGTSDTCSHCGLKDIADCSYNN